MNRKLLFIAFSEQWYHLPCCLFLFGIFILSVYFHTQEFEKLSEFIEKYYHATLTKRDMSLRGWNWGVADFVGESTLI